MTVVLRYAQDDPAEDDPAEDDPVRRSPRWRVQRATVVRRGDLTWVLRNAQDLSCQKVSGLVGKSQVDLYLWGECCIGRMGKMQVERFELCECVAN